MSKSLKNYPDPRQILDEFGADPLRAYLINSPVLRAEPLRFSESGVREVVRTVLIPLWNAYSFFTTYAEADGITLDDIDAAPAVEDRPELDRWILSVLQMPRRQRERADGGLLPLRGDPPDARVHRRPDELVHPPLPATVLEVAHGGRPDKISAFATLYEVLVTFSKVLAPILPFVTEELYQNLVVAHRVGPGPESVHHCDYPQADRNRIDQELEDSMRVVRQVVSLGHALRKQHQIKVRQPLGTAHRAHARPARRGGHGSAHRAHRRRTACQRGDHQSPTRQPWSSCPPRQTSDDSDRNWVRI